MTNTQQYSYVKTCHTGNSKIYTEPNGGTLFIGGWNQGAKFNHNTHVIDLTGNEHKFWDIPMPFDTQSQAFMPFIGQYYAGWLSLPFPDFKTPKGINSYSQWKGIADTIQTILRKGNDVLVACHGGHGRSGLFCSIVGYILNDGKLDGWKSPVDYVRSIHCFDAVETYEQEKYVYDILGLRIKIDKTIYEQNDDAIWDRALKLCPICGTQSAFVKEYGMCNGCKEKYAKIAPKRMDLTLKDIEGGGHIKHECENTKCFGIWKAEKCGHTTHDMIIYEGMCEICFAKHEQEAARAEELLATSTENCILCGAHTPQSVRNGVCYECAEEAVANFDVDMVHNSITDPYRAVPHECDNPGCVGIVIADSCLHVVHDRDVEDGLCPDCFEKKHGTEVK